MIVFCPTMRFAPTLVVQWSEGERGGSSEKTRCYEVVIFGCWAPSSCGIRSKSAKRKFFYFVMYKAHKQNGKKDLGRELRACLARTSGSSTGVFIEWASHLPALVGQVLFRTSDVHHNSPYYVIFSRSSFSVISSASAKAQLTL